MKRKEHTNTSYKMHVYKWIRLQPHARVFLKSGLCEFYVRMLFHTRILNELLKRSTWKQWERKLKHVWYSLTWKHTYSINTHTHFSEKFYADFIFESFFMLGTYLIIMRREYMGRKVCFADLTLLLPISLAHTTLENSEKILDQMLLNTVCQNNLITKNSKKPLIF